MTYEATRDRVETYFNRTATKAWEQLTSDAPVSRIRQTVRAGRDRMRAGILAALPADLTGRHVVDAGCGTGSLSEILAARGARVTAIDISPALIDVAKRRLPQRLHPQVEFVAGDFRDLAGLPADAICAMDSLIYYEGAEIGTILGQIRGEVLFTLPPRTPLLSMMWRVGKLFPRADRSPVMVPHRAVDLRRALAASGARGQLSQKLTVNSGFYHSTLYRYEPEARI